MDGGDVEAVGEQARHHRGDLLIEQDEITHDHRVVTHLLERGIRAQGKPGPDRHAFHGDLQVRAGHADPVHVAGHQLP